MSMITFPYYCVGKSHKTYTKLLVGEGSDKPSPYLSIEIEQSILKTFRMV